jgi:hypothetical protein
MIEIFSNF